MSVNNENTQLPMPLENTNTSLERSANQLTPARYAVTTFERLESVSSPLQNYLSLVMRRKRIMLLCLAVITGTTCIATSLMPRVYESTATLLVSQPSGSQSGALDDQIPAVMAAAVAPSLDTHVELVQGQPMAVETAKWLKAHGGPFLSPGAIRRSLRVKAVPKTQLVRISALGRSPIEAKKIANGVAQSYVAANRQRARSSADSANRYLSEQMILARKNLAEAETALRIFNETSGSIAEDGAVKNLLDRAASISADVDRTSADLAQTQENLGRIRVQLSQQNRSILAGKVRDNTILQRLRSKLTELEGEKLAARSRYTEAYSTPLQEIDRQIALVERQLDQQIHNVVGAGADLDMHRDLTKSLIEGESKIAAFRARRSQLETELQAVEDKLRKVPSRQIALARLNRQVEVAQGIHADLLKRSQEIEVGRVMALGNTDIAEPASVPRFPVKPNVPLNITLGLMLGLGVGFALALLQEQLDDTVRDQDDVAQIAGAPVLGAVPLFQGADNPVLTQTGVSHGKLLEAYRALRYSLGFVIPGEGSRVVLVTSANPAEGKTTTALNLAIAAAASGRRTILVDSDLRRPTIHRLVGLSEIKGISDVLVGEVGLSEVFQNCNGTGLRIIGSGTRVPNPPDLLDSSAMHNLVQQLRKEADIVIFDSPPLLLVADSLVLASLSDAILLVCVPGASHRRALQRSRFLLSHVGRGISGVVLNKIERSAEYGYYGRYYYYAYDYDYDAGEGDREVLKS